MRRLDGLNRGQLRIQWTLQGVLVGVLVVGLALRNVSVVVNAVVALSVTVLPAILERDHEVTLSPGLTLWISGAVTLHALGMVVLYNTIPWWDHLTHLVSGALVAGVGYALVRTIDEYTDAVRLSPTFVGVFVVLFTLAAGVLWEVLEMGGREIARAFGWEPILVVYGIHDTMLDLIVDGVAGVVVAVAGAPFLEGWVDRFLARLRRVE